MKSRKSPSPHSVAVVVLGDIGRSPRMMYHTQSFAEHDFVTDIIGYGGIAVKLLWYRNRFNNLLLGSKPIPALERLPKVQFHYLPEPPRFYGLLPFILLAPIKVFHQVASVLYVLLVQLHETPEFILVQVCPVTRLFSYGLIPYL